MPDKLGNYSRNTLKGFVGNADLRSLLVSFLPQLCISIATIWTQRTPDRSTTVRQTVLKSIMASKLLSTDYEVLLVDNVKFAHAL